jgi:hypothetical protein
MYECDYKPAISQHEIVEHDERQRDQQNQVEQTAHSLHAQKTAAGGGSLGRRIHLRLLFLAFLLLFCLFFYDLLDGPLEHGEVVSACVVNVLSKSK